MSKSNVEKMKAKRDVEGRIKALEDKEHRVPHDAAEALGEIGDARAVEPLIRCLSDEQLDIKDQAAESIWGK